VEGAGSGIAKLWSALRDDDSRREKRRGIRRRQCIWSVRTQRSPSWRRSMSSTYSDGQELRPRPVLLRRHPTLLRSLEFEQFIAEQTTVDRFRPRALQVPTTAQARVITARSPDPALITRRAALRCRGFAAVTSPQEARRWESEGRGGEVEGGCAGCPTDGGTSGSQNRRKEVREMRDPLMEESRRKDYRGVRPEYRNCTHLYCDPYGSRFAVRIRSGRGTMSR
jgi:hypothetical protein